MVLSFTSSRGLTREGSFNGEIEWNFGKITPDPIRSSMGMFITQCPETGIIAFSGVPMVGDKVGNFSIMNVFGVPFDVVKSAVLELVKRLCSKHRSQNKHLTNKEYMVKHCSDQRICSSYISSTTFTGEGKDARSVTRVEDFIRAYHKA